MRIMFIIMISMFVLAVAFLLGVYFGIMRRKKEKDRLNEAHQKELRELVLACEKYCRTVRKRCRELITKERQNTCTIKLPHENEPCIYVEKEKYQNVTVVVGECKKCGHIDISWFRQDDTEEVEVE